MKKRLLFINHNAEKFDGAGDEILRLLKHFSQQKNKYYIFGLFPKGKNQSNMGQYCDAWDTYTLSYVPVIGAGIKSIPGYLKNYFTLKHEFNKILSRNEKFDVAILNVSVMGWQAYFTNKHGIKNIVFIREFVQPRRIRKLLYNFLSKTCKYFFAVTDMLKEDFVKLTGKENISVYYSSIDESANPGNYKQEFLREILKDYISTDLNNNDLKFITVGSVCDRKNQMLLLETAKLIKERGNKINVSFYIVGDEYDVEYSKKLKEFIKRELLNNCYMLGPKSRDYIFNLFDYMDGLIVSSKSEGLPLTMVEALKFGIPVIGTDAGGVKDIIKDGENGLIIDRTPESLCNAITNLNNDKKLLEKFKKTGKETFKTKFDVQKNLVELTRVIDNLSKNNS